jgi:hypothetical protein
MPRPGSHKYDIKRRKLRQELEDKGVAPDAAADRQANAELQHDPPRTLPRTATGRRLSPKGSDNRPGRARSAD